MSAVPNSTDVEEYYSESEDETGRDWGHLQYWDKEDDFISCQCVSYCTAFN